MPNFTHTIIEEFPQDTVASDNVIESSNAMLYLTPLSDESLRELGLLGSSITKDSPEEISLDEDDSDC